MGLQKAGKVAAEETQQMDRGRAAEGLNCRSGGGTGAGGAHDGQTDLSAVATRPVGDIVRKHTSV